MSLLCLFLEIDWAYMSICCQHMLSKVFIRGVAPEILEFDDAIISFFRVASCWLRNLWTSKLGIAWWSWMIWTSCLALAFILSLLHIQPLMDRTWAAFSKLFVHFSGGMCASNFWLKKFFSLFLFMLSLNLFLLKLFHVPVFYIL